MNTSKSRQLRWREIWCTNGAIPRKGRLLQNTPFANRIWRHFRNSRRNDSIPEINKAVLIGAGVLLVTYNDDEKDILFDTNSWEIRIPESDQIDEVKNLPELGLVQMSLLEDDPDRIGLVARFHISPLNDKVYDKVWWFTDPVVFFELK